MTKLFYRWRNVPSNFKFTRPFDPSLDHHLAFALWDPALTNNAFPFDCWFLPRSNIRGYKFFKLDLTLFSEAWPVPYDFFLEMVQIKQMYQTLKLNLLLETTLTNILLPAWLLTYKPQHSVCQLHISRMVWQQRHRPNPYGCFALSCMVPVYCFYSQSYPKWCSESILPNALLGRPKPWMDSLASYFINLCMTYDAQRKSIFRYFQIYHDILTWPTVTLTIGSDLWACYAWSLPRLWFQFVWAAGGPEPAHSVLWILIAKLPCYFGEILTDTFI